MSARVNVLPIVIKTAEQTATEFQAGILNCNNFIDRIFTFYSSY
jgi:hypothetical protein